MNRTNTETVVAAAVDAAAELCPLGCDWLIDLLIDLFEDALAKDTRFPKLSYTAFDLFVADLRREAERQAAKRNAESVTEFTRILIDEIDDALADDNHELEALRRDQLDDEHDKFEVVDGEAAE